MRVYLAQLKLGPELDSPAAAFGRLASLDQFGRHQVTGDAEEADVILFTQCHMLPRDWRLTVIRDHALTRQFRHKVMVYDERDRPWCGFRGVYVSMPVGSFQHRYQRAWGYLPQTTPAFQAGPDLLFSFIGSPSDRSRAPLFKLKHSDAVVEEVHRFTFYDPSSPDFEQRRRRFKETLRRSRFVLCPRGRGTSSIRLYETLAAGRVPVIIADDWVAPAGPAWENFSIRWPENKVGGLVSMLEERSADWPTMSVAAAAAHREFFARDVWFHRVVELCRTLEPSQRQGKSLPCEGVHNGAFYGSAKDYVRQRLVAIVRLTAKRILRHFGLR